MSVTLDHANRLLSQVSSDKAFWLSDGKSINSLDDLAKQLPRLSDAVWSHHVTPERNDFSSWIKGVFHDEELANHLSACRDRKKAAFVIRQALAVVRAEVALASSPKIIEREEHMPHEKMEDMKPIVPMPPQNKVMQQKEINYQKHDLLEDHHKEHGHGHFHSNEHAHPQDSVKKEPEAHKRMAPVSAQVHAPVEKRPVVMPEPPTFEDMEQSPLTSPFGTDDKESMHVELHPKVRSRLGPVAKSHEDAMGDLIRQQEELEEKEKRMLEIEKRIEAKHVALAAGEPRHVTKELIYGILMGVLLTLIAGLVVLKFVFPGCLPI